MTSKNAPVRSSQRTDQSQNRGNETDFDRSIFQLSIEELVKQNPNSLFNQLKPIHDARLENRAANQTGRANNVKKEGVTNNIIDTSGVHAGTGGGGEDPGTLGGGFSSDGSYDPTPGIAEYDSFENMLDGIQSSFSSQFGGMISPTHGFGTLAAGLMTGNMLSIAKGIGELTGLIGGREGYDPSVADPTGTAPDDTESFYSGLGDTLGIGGGDSGGQSVGGFGGYGGSNEGLGGGSGQSPGAMGGSIGGGSDNDGGDQTGSAGGHGGYL